MIPKIARAAVLLVEVLTGLSPVDAAFPTLTPGTYSISALTTGFTVQSGNFCFPGINTFGWNLSFYITYYGGGKVAKATIPVPANPTATPGPYVVVLSFPPTPTGTSVRWTGNYVEKLLPVGGKFTSQTLVATLRPTSTRSFLGTMTLNRFSSGPGQSCDISFQYSAVFVGPLN